MSPFVLMGVLWGFPFFSCFICLGQLGEVGGLSQKRRPGGWRLGANVAGLRRQREEQQFCGSRSLVEVDTKCKDLLIRLTEDHTVNYNDPAHSIPPAADPVGRTH